MDPVLHDILRDGMHKYLNGHEQTFYAVDNPSEDTVDYKRAREPSEQFIQRKILHSLATDTTSIQTRPVLNENLPDSVRAITAVHNVETKEGSETQNRCLSTSLQ